MRNWKQRPGLMQIGPFCFIIILSDRLIGRIPEFGSGYNGSSPFPTTMLPLAQAVEALVLETS